jgi:hypothetical protein
MGSDGESGVVEGKLIKKLPHGRISYIDMALRDGSFSLSAISAASFLYI